ncbi:MAG: hypothetical protein M0C28_17380 [Candidatus Moduliflexus flocculans]|nr:hypothetical protein [Candidatus Moduliflexus flocculans]
MEDQYAGCRGDRRPHRRHDRSRLGRGHRPRQRPAGRVHPAPLRDRRQGGGHARGPAGCLRRGQPGRHRVRVPADPAERALTSAASRRTSATVITQTLVDQNDPAFQNPTKPIGSFHGRGRGQAPCRRNWAGRSSRTPAAAGGAWSPRRMPEAKLSSSTPVKTLLDAGVDRHHRGRRRHPGHRHGQRRLRKASAAVIDKDFASVAAGAARSRPTCS